VLLAKALFALPAKEFCPRYNPEGGVKSRGFNRLALVLGRKGIFSGLVSKVLTWRKNQL